MLAKVAAVSQFTGFARWAFADQSDAHSAHAQTPVKPHSYRPQFFAPAEYATLDRLTDLIIPGDDTPGARDAGVVEFIDFMAAKDPRLQSSFRAGLTWLDRTSKAAHGKEFLELPEGQQIDLLQTAASSKSDPEGTKFFLLAREYTVMGYYTSRIGLQALDYPGLKLYSQSPACPHPGNPEHKHLNGSGA